MKLFKQSANVSSRNHLKAVVDYGSWLLKVAAQHVRKGEVAAELPVDDIELKRGRYKIEQILAYQDEDRTEVVYGERETNHWASGQPDRLAKIVQQPKLALCPEFRNSYATRRIYTALDAETEDPTQLQDLIQAHLRAIKKAIIEWYAENSTNMSPKYPREYWRRLPVEVVITVPCK